MTSQIPDRIVMDDNPLSIVAYSHWIPFNPKDCGMYTLPLSSACWRGHWCVYKIQDGSLYLDQLTIKTMNDKYPVLNGVSAEDYGYEAVYEKLGLPVSYSGKILGGADFITDYYIHMGFQRPYAYRKLIEFTFEDGKLVSTADHSDIAEKIRKEIEQNLRSRIYEAEHAADFIHDSFSLDYETKCWWLEE